MPNYSPHCTTQNLHPDLNCFFQPWQVAAANMRKLVVPTLLVLALLFCSATAFLEPNMADSMNCGGKCEGRCAKAAVKDRCLKYCGICCAECKCVPSGTYGNKHQCPCYRDKRNSKGKPKCP